MHDGGYCDFTPPIESTLDQHPDPVGSALFTAQSSVEELARLWNDPATKAQVQAELAGIYRIFSNAAALVDVLMTEEGLMPPPKSKVVYLQDHLPAGCWPK